MRFLIDGYNLMHAAGYPVEGKAWDESRRKMVLWLRSSLGDAQWKAVFDGQRMAPAYASSLSSANVVFAPARSADEWIEETVQKDRGWTTVSNDRRVQEAGMRNGAGYLTCGQFLDELGTGVKREAVKPAAAEKPITTSASELAELEAAFRVPRTSRKRSP